MKTMHAPTLAASMAFLVLVLASTQSMAQDYDPENYEFKYVDPKSEKFPKRIDLKQLIAIDLFIRGFVDDGVSDDPVAQKIGQCNSMLFEEGFEISAITIEPYQINHSTANARSLPVEQIDNEYLDHIFVDSDGNAATPPDDILVRYVFPAPSAYP